MYQTIIDVTPSKFWRLVNKILRRETFWTVAYDVSGFVGEDWFDDNYQSKDDAIKSAQDYFDFSCGEIMYEDNLKHLKRSTKIAVAQYFFFNGERRYIDAEHVSLLFEEWAPDQDRYVNHDR